MLAPLEAIFAPLSPLPYPVLLKNSPPGPCHGPSERIPGGTAPRGGGRRSAGGPCGYNPTADPSLKTNLYPQFYSCMGFDFSPSPPDFGGERAGVRGVSVDEATPHPNPLPSQGRGDYIVLQPVPLSPLIIANS